jgi:arsenite-transporting ATPase
MVRAFDIPVGGVFVNMVLPEEIMKKEKSEYILNKYKEQEAYLATIRKDLWPLVRAFIPLYSTEVLGLDMISKVSESIVNWKP